MMIENIKNEVVCSLKNISKTINEKEILKNISLDIKRSEIFCFVGPNGSGKTTLLKIINLLEIPSSGELYLNNVRVFNNGFAKNHLKEEDLLKIRRRMTLIFQRPVVLKESVYENVAYPLKIRGEEDIKSRVFDALKVVGIEKHYKQRADTLSGGETTRLSLARAIVIRPSLILLDEPTGSLDPYSSNAVEDLIKRMNKEFNTTMVLVTHDMYEAKRIATRTGFLFEGQLIEYEKTDEFFKDPKDIKTKRFLSGELVV